MLVSNVVGTTDEPPFPMGMVVVTPTSPDPLELEFTVGKVGVNGRRVRSLRLDTLLTRPVGETDPSSPGPLEPAFEAAEVDVTGRPFGSLTRGRLVWGPVGGTDASGGVAEVVVNEPPVPVDEVLGTPVLLTGLVPDETVPGVKVM